MTAAAPTGVAAPLRAAFDAFDAAGVSWAVLRGSLATGDLGRDVDVLVGPGELDRVAEVIRAAGWVAIPGWTSGPRRSWLGFDPGGPHWPVLDCTDGLAFGRTPVRLDAAGCLRRAVVGDIRRLAPGDAWWVSCLHAFLDRAEPPDEAVLDKLRRTAGMREAGPGAPPLAPDGAARVASWDAERVVIGARAERWDEVAAAVRRLDGGGGLVRTLARVVAAVPTRAGRRLARTVRRAPRVAVVGEDARLARAVAAAASAGLPPSVRRGIRSTAEGPAADLAIRLERPAGPAGREVRATATVLVDPAQPEDALRTAVAVAIWEAIGRRWR